MNEMFQQNSSDNSEGRSEISPGDQLTEKPRQTNFRNLIIAALIIAVIAIADQMTKHWALDTLVNGRSMEVFGDFLRFTLVFNYGGAMGTNFGGPYLYLTMGVLILTFLLYYIWNQRHVRWFTITLSLIAGGAVGNLLDRVQHGKVVDWIDMDFFDVSLFGYDLHRFWTFNIADAAITCALVTLIWQYLIRPHLGPSEFSDQTAVQPDESNPPADSFTPPDHKSARREEF